jgi:hypothetical protein
MTLLYMQLKRKSVCVRCASLTQLAQRRVGSEMDANLFVCGVKVELVSQLPTFFLKSLTHSIRTAVRREKFSGDSVVESFNQYVISRITLLDK